MQCSGNRILHHSYMQWRYSRYTTPCKHFFSQIKAKTYSDLNTKTSIISNLQYWDILKAFWKGQDQNCIPNPGSFPCKIRHFELNRLIGELIKFKSTHLNIFLKQVCVTEIKVVHLVRCGVDFHSCYYFTRETATCIEMNTCKSYNCYNNVTTVIHVVMVMAGLVIWL